MILFCSTLQLAPRPSLLRHGFNLIVLAVHLMFIAFYSPALLPPNTQLRAYSAEVFCISFHDYTPLLFILRHDFLVYHVTISRDIPVWYCFTSSTTYPS